MPNQLKELFYLEADTSSQVLWGLFSRDRETGEQLSPSSPAP